MNSTFLLELGTQVRISISGEVGVVIARAQYLYSEDAYLVRYKSVDGRAVDQWWGASALEMHIG